jgi:hypothetical protein
MATTIIECSFLIPLRRDANLSDGEEHEKRYWEWLDAALHGAFGGRTIAPGIYRGAYTDPDTHERVADESIKYVVAVPESDLRFLRIILSVACTVFQQKCIYVNVGGRVEFIGADDEGRL